jgi:hypothetical protein
VWLDANAMQLLETDFFSCVRQTLCAKRADASLVLQCFVGVSLRLLAVEGVGMRRGALGFSHLFGGIQERKRTPGRRTLR